jgi:hypothetical protein
MGLSPSEVRVTEDSNRPAAPQRRFYWPAFKARAVSWLGQAIFLALIVLVASGPFSAAAARLAFEVAGGLWIVKLILQGFRLRREPLAVPLLSFFLVSAASTLLSYSPWLSWERLRWYGLFLIFFLVVENLTTAPQLRTVVAALLLATLVSAIQTGWQFTAGIGTQLVSTPSRAMFDAGLLKGDIIREVNGRSARTLRLLRRALASKGDDAWFKMRVARPFPGGVRHVLVSVRRNDLEQWLQAGGQVAHGRPPRAQGHFYHAIPYGGLLMEVAGLCFGLLIAAWKRPGARIFLLLAFVLVSASLWATATRSYMIALLLGCVAAVWATARWKARALAVASVLVVLGMSAFWVRGQRHVSMFSANEPGTEYRMLMWRDSLRLVRQHPVLGIGLDAARRADNPFDLRAYKLFPLQHGHFHSTYIEVAVDCGLAGLGIWLWLMAAYFRHLWRLLRGHFGDWFSRGLALGMFVSAVAFYLGCLVQYTLGDGEVMQVVWLQMGCSIVLWRLTRAGLPRQDGPPASPDLAPAH